MVKQIAEVKAHPLPEGGVAILRAAQVVKNLGGISSTSKCNIQRAIATLCFV
jgi:hypothetical protein